MKKRNLKDRTEITLGTDGMKCSKCLHERKDEPFLREVKYLSSGGVAFYYTCWRCCRDAESTFLIQQKWPIAFVRYFKWGAWQLEWSPGVKELVGGTDGNKS